MALDPVTGAIVLKGIDVAIEIVKMIIEASNKTPEQVLADLETARSEFNKRPTEVLDRIKLPGDEESSAAKS